VIAFSSDGTPENDHYDLIARCLESIAAHTDPRKYRLLIGCNNLSPRAMRLVDWFRNERGATIRIGRPRPDADGRLVFPKYPVMRSLYRATRAPWVVWFDDDTYATEPDWLERLEEAINRHPNAEQFGKRADTPMANPGPGWIETAPWYNPAIVHEHVSLGDGTARVVCDYVVGGFYAISREAICRCSIPDERLFHNGGDWTTGLALKHQGFGIAHHTYGVAINRAPRRIEEERLLFEGAVKPGSLARLREWPRPDGGPPS
jgi:GT2 family glycosyltransferase